ncbi:uncharacterized protein LOC144335937 isoform X2 [Macaca mulatta]
MVTWLPCRSKAHQSPQLQPTPSPPPPGSGGLTQPAFCPPGLPGHLPCKPSRRRQGTSPGSPDLFPWTPGLPRAESRRRTVPRKEAPQKGKRRVRSPGDSAPRPEPRRPDPNPGAGPGSPGAHSRCRPVRKRHQSRAERSLPHSPWRSCSAQRPARPSTTLRAACDPEAAPRGQRLLPPPSPPQTQSQPQPLTQTPQPPGRRSTSASSLPLPVGIPRELLHEAPPRSAPARLPPAEKAQSAGAPSRPGPHRWGQLAARAHAPDRPAAGGLGTAPPPGRRNPLGARTGK